MRGKTDWGKKTERSGVNLPRRSAIYCYIRLFRDYEVVVLFASLHEQVFVVQQVGCGNFLVEGIELLFVERDSAALHQFSHLAFRREHFGVFGKQVYCFYASGQ